MELNKLTDRIYYLSHEPEVDRPMLAYIKGEKFSLAIDAGYSASHVEKFYKGIKECGFTEPDFTVITHWHYDHTFGMNAIKGISIAHKNTNQFLQEQKDKAQNRNYINELKADDIHFQKEYEGKDEVDIVLSDVQFEDRMVINLGGLTADIFHTVSPHSEDTVCVYIPEEKVLFLGDSTSEDFFNGGYMDYSNLECLVKMIEAVDCEYCILSHCEPLKKDDLLAYLKSI